MTERAQTKTEGPAPISSPSSLNEKRGLFGKVKPWLSNLNTL